MKEKSNIAEVEDTEEMRKWKGLSHSEMDLCWKNLPGRMEEEVLENTRSKKAKEAFRGGGALLEWRKARENKRYRIRKWWRRLLAEIFLFV